jgi:potassium/hydrogen antiporter
MVEITLALSIIGLIVLLGFAGNVLFKKSNIPNVLWLLFFGVVLSYFDFLEKDFLISIAGLIGAIAIIGILSDGGMHLNLKTVLTDGSVGWLLMFVGLIFSAVSSIVVLSFFGFSFEIGFLVGMIIAGTSASVVIPILVSLNVSEKIKTILSIESLADTFSIVIALLAMKFISGGFQSFSTNIIQTAALEVFAAISLGVIFGFLWAPLILRFRTYDFSYSATLGALVLLYAFAELVGANGAITIFSAGLMIANAHFVSKALFPEKYSEELDSEISTTHSLIAFLIRVFFFVFLGILVGLPEPNFLLMGFLVTTALLVFRIAYIELFAKVGIIKIPLKEKRLAFFSFPRGLSSAMLSMFAFSFNLPQAYEIAQIVFSIILFSVIFTTFGVYFVLRLPDFSNVKKTAS